MNKFLVCVFFAIFSVIFIFKISAKEIDSEKNGNDINKNIIYYNKTLLSTLLLNKSLQANSLLIPKNPNSLKKNPYEGNKIIEIPKTPTYKIIN